MGFLAAIVDVGAKHTYHTMQAMVKKLEALVEERKRVVDRRQVDLEDLTGATSQPRA